MGASSSGTWGHSGASTAWPSSYERPRSPSAGPPGGSAWSSSATGRIGMTSRASPSGIPAVALCPAIAKKYVPAILRALDGTVVHATATPVYRYGISFNKLFEYMAGGPPGRVRVRERIRSRHCRRGGHHHPTQRRRTDRRGFPPTCRLDAGSEAGDGVRRVGRTWSVITTSPTSVRCLRRCWKTGSGRAPDHGSILP